MGVTKNGGLKVSPNPATRQHAKRKVSDGTWSRVSVFIDKPTGKTRYKQNEGPLLAAIVRALDSHLSSSVDQLVSDEC